MILVYNILQELGYQATETFSITLGENKNFQVLPFISVQTPSQVYLVITIKQDMLQIILKEEFLPTISKVFQSQSYFIADMAKNTSLLLLNPCEVSSNRGSSDKLHIEDDPLYFKKYVLSYTEFEYLKALEYISFQKELIGESFRYTKTVQEYLLNSKHFDNYKNNNKNEPIYTYLAELSTKLPILPMPIANTTELISVNSFLKEEIKIIATKKQNPICVEPHKLDMLLESIQEWRDVSTEIIVNQWRSIDVAISEGGGTQ